MWLGKGVLATAQVDLSADSELCSRLRVPVLMCSFVFNCNVKHWSVPTKNIKVPENNMQDVLCT